MTASPTVRWVRFPDRGPEGLGGRDGADTAIEADAAEPRAGSQCERCGGPQHRLSSKTMAPITSDCDAMCSLRSKWPVSPRILCPSVVKRFCYRLAINKWFEFWIILCIVVNIGAFGGLRLCLGLQSSIDSNRLQSSTPAMGPPQIRSPHPSDCASDAGPPRRAADVAVV